MGNTVSLKLRKRLMVWFQSSVVYQPSEPVRVMELDTYWAVLSNGYRCNRYTGEVDGKGERSPGTVYASKEDYERELLLLNAWRKLQRDIANKKFLKEDLTRRNILQVRRLLNLDE